MDSRQRRYDRGEQITFDINKTKNEHGGSPPSATLSCQPAKNIPNPSLISSFRLFPTIFLFFLASRLVLGQAKMTELTMVRPFRQSRGGTPCIGFETFPFYPRGQASGGRGQKSEVRGQRSGVRSQRSAVNGQKSAVRSQRSEVSGQRSGGAAADWGSALKTRGQGKARCQRSKGKGQRSAVRRQGGQRLRRRQMS